MTPTEVELVQHSFRRLSPLADQVAGLFCARLFELDPRVRSLFCGCLHDQGRTWIATLGSAVASLHDLESLLPSMRALGARHGGQGLLEEHYAAVGDALLWTLHKGLGPEFTPAVREAWFATYSLLAQAMIEGHRHATPPAQTLTASAALP
ncbi:globin domain-containing protein [Horticoccus sp. 23ND18S-11]|uniref:globin domain-containing protein n=1 Tax=Horticoccus sp. 23ND18S-11 TaxID=3391832 RepID=UPI0039C91B1A